MAERPLSALTLQEFELAAEVVRLAEALKETPERVLAQCVRDQLPQLRAAAIQPPRFGAIESSVGSEIRAEAERMALAAAIMALPISASEPPAWAPGEIPPRASELASIGEHMFADAALRNLRGRARDRVATWQDFPEEIRHRALTFRDTDAVAPLAVLEPSEVSLEVTFNVHGQFGLPNDRSIETFGGASTIRLRSGPSPLRDDGLRRLVGVEVTVPVDQDHPLRGGRLPPHDMGGPYWNPHLVSQDGSLHSPEFQTARDILDHVLSVIRLSGRRVAFEPWQGKLGPPWSCAIVLKFTDGSFIKRITDAAFAFSVSVGPSNWELLDGLRLDSALFRETYESAREVVALLSDGPACALFDRFRRAALIVESRFNAANEQNRRTLRKGVETPAFRELVQRTHPGANPTEIARDVIAARNEAAHLVRAEVDGTALSPHDAYGLRIFDPGQRSRILSALPVVERLARRVLDEAIPTFAHREEHSLADLLDLWSEGGLTGDHELLCASEILSSAMSQERDPRLPAFLDARLERRHEREAWRLAEVCHAVGSVDSMLSCLDRDPPDTLTRATIFSLLRAEETRERLLERAPHLPASVLSLLEQARRDLE